MGNRLISDIWKSSFGVVGPQRIVCVGRNYGAHLGEEGEEPPVAPLLFAKFANTIIGPGEPIARRVVLDRLHTRARRPGTPGGVGYFHKPRVSLAAGDVVEVAIGGLGKVSNPVATTGGDR